MILWDYLILILRSLVAIGFRFGYIMSFGIYATTAAKFVESFGNISLNLKDVTYRWCIDG